MHVALCSTIIDLVVALAGVVLKDFPLTKSLPETKKAVTIIVNKIGAYFPFGNLNEIRGQKVQVLRCPTELLKTTRASN